MATTTPSGTPVPTMGDAPNVPADLLKLATYLEPITTPRFTDDATASAGLPSKQTGQAAIIGGVRKTWNGASWIESSALPAIVAGNTLGGSVPANTQLRIAGGMNVLPTNVFGQIRIFPGFSTCVLTAWAGNGDPNTGPFIFEIDAANSNSTSFVIRIRNAFNGGFLGDGALVRFVWGAIGI